MSVAKFTSEGELEIKALEYIKFLDGDTTLQAPLGVKNTDVPTKAGLRIWLDVSPPVYVDYKNKYPNALKRVENIIEDSWVQRLAGNNVTGAIFYLKNAFKEEYKDRTETALSFDNDEAKEKADKLVKDYLGNTKVNRE